MTPRLRRNVRGLRVSVIAGFLVVCPVAHAGPAASASYKLTGQLLDAAGGRSSSAGYSLVSCLDHTPSGASASASFRVASGCGWELQILAGVPNALTVTGGSPQTAGINKVFFLPLQVTVKDLYLDAVAGMTVVYTAPASGASATLSNGGIASTDASGIASVVATANGSTGTYTVDGVLSGLPVAPFLLTNDTSPVSLQIFTAE
ncbi:MAG: hypothetical protein ABIT01_13145 [Thermoanaerobaculia bacterium]